MHATSSPKMEQTKSRCSRLVSCGRLAACRRHSACRARRLPSSRCTTKVNHPRRLSPAKRVFPQVQHEGGAFQLRQDNGQPDQSQAADQFHVGRNLGTVIRFSSKPVKPAIRAGQSRSKPVAVKAGQSRSKLVKACQQSRSRKPVTAGQASQSRSKLVEACQQSRSNKPVKSGISRSKPVKAGHGRQPVGQH